VDQSVQIRVELPEFVHFANRVKDRRMVLAAEVAADLGQ
jgi:hypothetical protein